MYLWICFFTFPNLSSSLLTGVTPEIHPQYIFYMKLSPSKSQLVSKESNLRYQYTSIKVNIEINVREIETNNDNSNVLWDWKYMYN